MPNLVGIGNSQVPTNAMLGGLAYQDSVGEIDIDKIKAQTGDTAVDIFVYDTRKDSDGGAWRYRTQNTSWYNEGASATRGARKEFPAVAIIVTEAAQVTIYDGDDPNLPMWMVFNNTGSDIANVGILGRTQDANKAAEMLNGILFVGNANYFATYIPFISENVTDFIDSYASVIGPVRFNGNIEQRNEGLGKKAIAGNKILAGSVNDVAMTVLPNAPIDASTGLPVPTIAVATANGVSVIRDDGNVVDLTNSTNDIQRVHFQGSRLHINSSSIGAHWIYDIIPSIDSALDPTNGHFEYWDPNYTNLYNPAYIGWNNPSIAANYIGTTSHNGGVSGLTLFDYNKNNHTRSSVAFITSTYNTGHMVGDIKGAFLSDTDDTNVTGSNLITNANFDSNVNNWVENFSTNTHSSGRMQITRSGGTGATAYQAFTTEVGKTYVATAEVNSSGSRGDLHVRNGTGWGGTGLLYVAGTAGQTQVLSGSFTATSTTSTIAFGVDNDGTSIFVDNVSVRAAEFDRSINQKELQIFGTVTKSAVATGAELIAYSGFNNSNYLQQPYNSDLDFGTGDLYIMFWANFTQNDAYDLIMARRAHNGSAYTGNGWYIEMGNDQNIQIKDSVGGTRAQIDPDSVSGVWQHMCFVRRNNVGYGYKNGVIQSNTYTWNENLSNTSAVLTIGRGTISGSGDADKTRLALVRIGGTVAPSEEQINKIYNDEKCLFHENAKCTLHGTSDEVTGLAFDDTTNVLHVGTSSGRSDFRGLNRINNTTTAVTTAISASNGLVAEQ